MALPIKLKMNQVTLTVETADVSTAGQSYVAPGFHGKIKRAMHALGGAITVADAGVTLKIDGVAVTGGTMTIANASSAAGDVDVCKPTGANTFTDTSHIEVEWDGASTDTAPGVVTLILEAT